MGCMGGRQTAVHRDQGLSLRQAGRQAGRQVLSLRFSLRVRGDPRGDTGSLSRDTGSSQQGRGGQGRAINRYHTAELFRRRSSTMY